MRRLLLALLGLLLLPLLPIVIRRNPFSVLILLPAFEAMFCALYGCTRGPDTANQGW